MALQFDKVSDLVESYGFTLEPLSSYYKVADETGTLKIYIAKTKKVNRIDFSGFTVEHSTVTQISEAEAKDQRMGNVRGQIVKIDDEDGALDALLSALEILKGYGSSNQEEIIAVAI